MVRPYLSIRKIGRRIVQALNLDTKKKAVVHLNDLKELKRPGLASVSVKEAVLYLIEKNQDLSDLRDKIVWNSSDGSRMKKIDVWFLDLCEFEEFLPIVASGSCKTDMLVCTPEWKEHPGYEFHESINGDSYLIDFEDVSLAGAEINPMFGFKIWVTYYKIADLKAGRSKALTLQSGEEEIREVDE